MWLAGVVSACGGGAHPTNAASPAPAEAAVAPKKGPVDLKAMEAREVEASPAAPFTAKDKSFAGAIESKGAPKVSYHEGFTEVVAPIGTEIPVICMVYDQDIRVGASLQNTIAHIEGEGKVKFLRVSVDSVDAIAGAGGVYATALYGTQVKGSQAVGTLKLFFHGSLEHGVMCLHDEVGYRQAFARVTRGLVESLKYSSQLGKTRLIEIVRAKIADKPVGYLQSFLIEAPNGVLLSISSSARLLPVAPTELSTSDSLEILGLDADRRIVNGKYSEFDGPTESLSLDLMRSEKNHYKYQGTTHQKPISGEFTSKEKKGLVSGALRDQQVAELSRAKKSKVLKFEDYTPGEDPTRTEQVTASVNGAEHRVKIDWGNVSFDQRLDDEGFAASGEAHLGKATLSLERIVRDGHL